MKKFNIDIPNNKLPIYIIGAGGIVHDAHLPAYDLAGFEVKGIYDLDQSKACELKKLYNVGEIFSSLDELVASAPEQCVFDVAVPGDAVLSVLSQLPDYANVLIQKPMGETLDEAEAILELCRQKFLNAGINFQLRYAPFIAKARQMIDDGLLGDIYDIEVNVNVYTPWHLWDFLFEIPRVEILYHSIHYLDLIRTFLGNPERIYAKTVKDPKMLELAPVRTSMIFDYGDIIRANVHTNHGHKFGLDHQHSYIKFEGTKGAIKCELGVLKNYPEGEPDSFEYALIKNGKSTGWIAEDIDGTWFPHAFIGSMSQVMMAATGQIEKPDNSVEDCIHTMEWVEAAYRSSDGGGVRMSELIAVEKSDKRAI